MSKYLLESKKLKDAYVALRTRFINGNGSNGYMNKVHQVHWELMNQMMNMMNLAKIKYFSQRMESQLEEIMILIMDDMPRKLTKVSFSQDT